MGITTLSDPNVCKVGSVCVRGNFFLDEKGSVRFVSGHDSLPVVGPDLVLLPGMYFSLPLTSIKSIYVGGRCGPRIWMETWTPV